MPEMDDIQFLCGIIERPSDANEEITQAVFSTLARKTTAVRS